MATVNMISVSKYYENQMILNQIDLSIEKGEFVAVVGPSGSGKSTLLRLVAGLETVSQGSILINDQCVNTIPAPQRNMAMVFQNYALYPHMTVYANMAYGLKMRGMKKQLIRERVEQVGKLLQLSDYLHRKPMALSGGQRQRVAMGRAMVRSPAVFLFDEPLSNLDAKLRTEMRHEIKKLHQQFSTTSLYVTHDQTEAMTLADRIVILNQGLIEQVGTPKIVYQQPETMFVASFIGNYPINFIPAKLSDDRRHLVTEVGCRLPAPKFKTEVSTDQAVMIGIRPENMDIVSADQKGHLKAKLDWIDDMGADKLLQVLTEKPSLKLCIRLSENPPAFNENISVGLTLKNANVFCAATGQRLGGWDTDEKA